MATFQELDNIYKYTKNKMHLYYDPFAVFTEKLGQFASFEEIEELIKNGLFREDRRKYLPVIRLYDEIFEKKNVIVFYERNAFFKRFVVKENGITYELNLGESLKINQVVWEVSNKFDIMDLIGKFERYGLDDNEEAHSRVISQNN